MDGMAGGGHGSYQGQGGGFPDDIIGTQAATVGVGGSLTTLGEPHQMLNQSFGVNMSYTQLLLAADHEAAFLGSSQTNHYPVGAESAYLGSPHTSFFPVGAENETFMITGRSSHLSDGSGLGGNETNFNFQDAESDNWNNGFPDDYGASSFVHALSWRDGVPAPGADLLNAWGVSLDNSGVEDDALSDDSDIGDLLGREETNDASEECTDLLVVENAVENANDSG